jgi:hypothetical protein
MRALAVIILVGCASEPPPPPPVPPAPRPVAVSRDRQLIEKAFAARDARTLRELVEVTTGDDQAIAREHYVRIELDALVALDCDAFVAAFEPIKHRANPRTAFGGLTTALEPRAKAYIASAVLGVAARCRSPLMFSPAIRRAAPDADDAVWANAVIELDRKGLPVYDAFLRALKSPAAQIDPALANAWLVATRNCRELEAVPRVANPNARASLAYFHGQKGCPERVAR